MLSIKSFALERSHASQSDMRHRDQEQPGEGRLSLRARSARAARLSPLELDVMELAEGREPAALFPEDPRVARAANQLAEAGILGEVEVRGDTAYRLTEFGRVTLALRREQKTQPET